jgi:glyoxylase-like metal-dependent hydrolase (beta-lactamase superfamily II)/nitroimidazol reductase NimA-like FMN-containing flavoprotein (pyridoxamine 5'-phosphate oxidase superfamily)
MSIKTSQPKAPVIDTSAITEITDGVWVIPDSDHTPMVPNIGIVIGARATLVIDTGFGPDNARAVLEQARRLSGGRPIFVTHTHCHPEHGYGANAVAGEVTIVYNDAQWSELQQKGPIILRMFRKQMPALAPMLDGVEFVPPHLRYTGSLNLDLGGGHIAELREFGGAHSLGDQGILVRGSTAVLFTGDLVEEGTFGVLGDSDSHTVPWIDRLKRFEQLDPELVVPGHGHTGGPERIANYRRYLELAKRRVDELRAAGELSEGEIVDRVSAEVLGLYPDWQNQVWARKAVEDLTWPARALSLRPRGGGQRGHRGSGQSEFAISIFVRRHLTPPAATISRNGHSRLPVKTAEMALDVQGGAMSTLSTPDGGSASPSAPGGPEERVIENMRESECMRLLGGGRVGRLAYTGREGPTVLPIVYKLHEGSIVFHPLQGTFTEQDLRTGIAHADYEVAFEIDQIDPDVRGGWAVLVVGSAHHVDTEAERASIIGAGADPWPWPEAEAVHLMRVRPLRITGRRSYLRTVPADS